MSRQQLHTAQNFPEISAYFSRGPALCRQQTFASPTRHSVVRPVAAIQSALTRILRIRATMHRWGRSEVGKALERGTFEVEDTGVRITTRCC